jgi:hypothetical protein
MIVKSEVPMEGAKALVLYWHWKQCHAQKMHAKLLARARRTWPSHSTTTWKRALERREDIQHHALAADVYLMRELMF